MKLTTAAALLSLALGPIGTTASAPADIAITSFSADKNFGHISYKTHFHTPLHHGSQIPLECRALKTGSQDSFRFGPSNPIDIKWPAPGIATVHRSASEICFTTNSMEPCMVRLLLAFNETWVAAYSSFPYTGSSAFEGCFDKGVMALTRNWKTCLDLRVARLCTLRDNGVSYGMGESLCASGWKCKAYEEEGEEVEGNGLQKQW